MAESIRSFISFDVENEAVLGRIIEAQKTLNKTGANLKLVKPKNIHVTMRFLGNIRPSMIEKVYEEMKEIQFSPFTVKIEGVGVFPNLQYMRVVWAGITEGSEEMEKISRQLEPRLRQLGFSPDGKEFSPHMTIARVKSGRNKGELARCIEDNAHLQFGTLKAECLRLKRSDLTPAGPTYSTLKEFCSQNPSKRSN